MNHYLWLIHETVESINTQESEPAGAPAQVRRAFFVPFSDKWRNGKGQLRKGGIQMVHLTNDYRKLLRRNGPKAALSLCVALALSGGLVSAEGKTYDYVSPWSMREALEGDSIEVGRMFGGDGKLQAGTDKTGEVRIHALWTWGDPEVYVKGKQITIDDENPNYLDNYGKPIQAANWGGKMSIGGDAAESVTMEGFRTFGKDSVTTIQGGSVSMGSLDNWGGERSLSRLMGISGQPRGIIFRTSGSRLGDICLSQPVPWKPVNSQ